MVNVQVENVTLEERAAEHEELSRTTRRGWELLQSVSGWWTYAFCNNSELTQFHQLPPRPGEPLLPLQPDPAVEQFVLAKSQGKEDKKDEWGIAKGEAR
ncbi:hypothetical protein BUE80_DR010216 [Diplocarpon rosae]|nr:hypothetical protein BUE80_DR010216 [Diplocarpon rosae]